MYNIILDVGRDGKKMTRKRTWTTQLKAENKTKREIKLQSDIAMTEQFEGQK